MPNPYISRVVIKNFRNFTSVDIYTSSKQVVFGENESGKTNYLFALQLILDSSLSDDDRCLSSTDFNNSITDPVESRSEILISLYLSDFEESKTILAQLSDAVVTIDGKRYIKLTYRYFPEVNALGQIEYKYNIFKGEDENNVFSPRDRRYLQIKVVKPLRDVEYELRNYRVSPFSRLLGKYDIPVEKLSRITEEMHSQSNALLSIDELNDLAMLIKDRLVRILGHQSNSSVEFAMADIDASKIFNALKIMLSGRLLEEKSLGIKNVLYIILLLLQFHDEGVPTLIRERDFANYSEKDTTSCLIDSYEKTSEGNYRLANRKRQADLARFFRENQQIGIPDVIIAIEEPEAHLHPILQRLVFRDVVFNSMHSVLLTTHSTHIASVSPIEYMVHILQTSPSESKISTFDGLELMGKDKLDIERYLDVSRGEVYFGKGVILVEGIAEQYLIPSFAELIGLPLDKHGVVVCSVNSTNFLPYSAFLTKMNIPHVVLTDGDFYYEDPNGKRIFGTLRSPSDPRDVGSRIMVQQLPA